MRGMDPVQQRRPLTTGDVAYLLTTDPDYLKKWIKKGTRYGVPFCRPRWVSTTDQRLFAYGDLVVWADENGFEIRSFIELKARVDRRAHVLGWQLIDDDDE